MTTSPTSRLRPPASLRRWALPAVLAVVAAVEAAVNPEIADGSGTPAVFAVAMTLPLAWRVEEPGRALAGVVGVFAVQELFGPGTLSEAIVPFLVLVAAMYSAGARLRPDRVLPAAAGCSVVIAATIAVDARGWDPSSTVYALVVVAAAFLAGRVVGARTREVHALVGENEGLLRDREERERAAAARERMRIAHELHDLITHRVSAMVLQASAERRVVERGHQPAAADTLASIEDLGREALAELRQLLGALHHDGDEPRAPQPGVDQLVQLVDQSARAGLQVTLEILGEARELPGPVEVSIYRLAQESLSNAMRHAPGATAQVVLAYDQDAVTLRISNGPGRTTRPADPGRGLGVAGMQERASQFGGTLEAGPTPDGGYQVVARLPVPSASDAGPRRG